MKSLSILIGSLCGPNFSIWTAKIIIIIIIIIVFITITETAYVYLYKSLQIKSYIYFTNLKRDLFTKDRLNLSVLIFGRIDGPLMN